MSAAFQRSAEGSGSPDGWRLLGEVFNIHLRHSNAREPLGPMLVMDGRRSMIPSDLDGKQRGYLRSLLAGVRHPDVRARLGDVLWIAERDAGAARAAVEAYLDAADRLGIDAPWSPAAERYERAVRLAKSLGRQGPLLAVALDRVLCRVVAMNGDDPLFHSHRLLGLLDDFRHGDPDKLAALALRAAARNHANGDARAARMYYLIAARLLRRIPAPDREREARAAAAETLVEEASINENAGNLMAAQALFEEAIQAFRELPSGKERLPDLHARLNAAGQESLKAMKPVGMEVDISELAPRARGAVAGCSLGDAICTLGSLTGPLDPDRLRQDVLEQAKSHPLLALVPSYQMDAGGRVIQKIPSLMTDDPDEHEAGIRGRMERNAELERWLAVRGLIVPALLTLLEEHTPGAPDISELLEGSMFIPKSRMNLFAAGFAAGFHRDMPVALSLLIPQAEYAIRAILAERGVIPSHIDQDGIQEDWPLGKALAEPLLLTMIGPELVFELKSLMTEKAGGNLRNRFAHGMMEADEFQSVPGIYLWWLLLRMALPGSRAMEAWTFEARDSGPDASS
ncbi:DUF4209 domain-containing protein [Muricoccus radiodurans]|uniref:DUF4209 domain-containing protein n=1 Tax=Muricoccus radiodurans TaxID=2231721 RepID=UPI003CF1E8B7